MKVEAMRSAPEYKQIKYSKSNFKYLCEISALLLKHYINVLPNMIDEQSIEMAHASVDCFRECLTTAVVLYERKFADFLKVLGEQKMSIISIEFNIIIDWIFILN